MHQPKLDLAAKETKYKAEESLLELYQEVHARLEAKHNQLRAKNAAKETAKDQPVDAKNVYQGEAIHHTQDKSSKAKQNVSATGVKTEQIGNYSCGRLDSLDLLVLLLNDLEENPKNYQRGVRSNFILFFYILL